jgi:hypothetical protein
VRRDWPENINHGRYGRHGKKKRSRELPLVETNIETFQIHQE